MTQPLPRSYATLLCNLAEAGGAGALDRYGRVVTGPSRALLAGGPEAWLTLVTKGFVAGENDRILLTEAGREEAQRYQDGLTKGAA